MTLTPRIYIVGGYVRDLLLKREGFDVSPKDRDFVVVGATPEYMASKGFMPVGADFPVFLHPKTHEEYALARTERKTAPGYRGFAFHASPEVTLEEDLRRRDLTVNAIAMDEAGHLTDPWDGEGDIKRRIFRHVSNAFCEDPVRILRLARFCARLPEFSIAPDTEELVRSMVKAGEVDALVPERVNKEVLRGLMEKKPSAMLRVLASCGAWERIAPGIPCTEKTLAALDRAAEAGAALPVRFAILLAPAGEKASAAAKALRASTDLIRIAQLAGRFLPLPVEPTVSEVIAILEKADSFRRLEHFEALLEASEILSGTDAGFWRLAAKAASGIDPRQAIASASTPREIPAAIRAARMKALAPLFPCH